MDIDVVRTRATGENGPAQTSDRSDSRRAIDISDVPATRLEEYARTAVDHDRVHLEHRGGRTFLVADD
ncbi:hypothetical protein ACFQPA_12550 [Halomarina halobia]|uniref:Uncharacterized protein n=1 Tax=Halomarina halobia TaxID=3033386 RepID=A0ABD6A9K8_9EURY|nr:hypothetical protein [Halomarina sp. PSR21]